MTTKTMIRDSRMTRSSLADGAKTREIALALHISEKTVETHRRNIMEKLNLHSVAELTKYAIQQGLTTVEGYKGCDLP